MGSIYDGQADRAIWEFCDLTTRFRDPTSERLKPIQSARAEHDLRAVRLPRAKFYVASPIPLPSQPARRGGRMLSELAPVTTTTLFLIPGMKFCFPVSTNLELRSVSTLNH
jgi:hypothetical protein